MRYKVQGKFLCVGQIVGDDSLCCLHTPRTSRGFPMLAAMRRHITIVEISAAMQTCVLCRLAYPMPPAGADPETWVPEEEPQPIGFSVSLPQGSILPGAHHYLPSLTGCIRNAALLSNVGQVC